MTVDRAPTDEHVACWGRADSILWRRLLDSIIVDVSEDDDSTFIEISGGGVEIWDLLEDDRTLAEITEALRARLNGQDEDPEMEQEVGRFLKEMTKAGVLVQR